jgi:hypothetical protein
MHIHISINASHMAKLISAISAFEFYERRFFCFFFCTNILGIPKMPTPAASGSTNICLSALSIRQAAAVVGRFRFAPRCWQPPTSGCSKRFHAHTTRGTVKRGAFAARNEVAGGHARVPEKKSSLARVRNSWTKPENGSGGGHRERISYDFTVPTSGIHHQAARRRS